ncbi:MAG: DNA polymerase III subunit delta [Rhodospirillaceae bacterium]|nr:DNA polymerase III subunit delta [Rhodospirillaceae bacterium]MBT6136882.1 DNA polymerase III subunit delta [Rhodospirillaceae bacterium]
MKTKAHEVDRFIANPPAQLRAALVYGPDVGKVREVSDKLSLTAVEDPSDPFRVAEIVADQLKDDPARLADEMGAMALTGGRRVVRLRTTNEGLVDILRAAIEETPGDTLLVVESSMLDGRSKTRKLFEDGASTVALPCFADAARDLERLIREVLQAADIKADNEAIAYLRDSLGGDRLMTRSELDKLVLLVGIGGHLTYEDAVGAVGDSGELILDDIAFAVADGAIGDLDRSLTRANALGINAIAILRATLGHFQRLHILAAAISEGRPGESAVGSIRPPVYGPKRERLLRQGGRWSERAITDTFRRLGEGEVTCKSTGAPMAAICGQLLLGIAVRAGRNRNRA